MNNSFFIPDSITINGGKPISGIVNISGAKNSILGLMAASVLTDQAVTLTNVPYISDVLEMGHLLQELGVHVKHDPHARILRLHAKEIKSNELGNGASKFRASYYLWGALLARFSYTGEFDSLHVYEPGGCAFGKGKSRPTNFHHDMIKSVFNAKIVTDHQEKYSVSKFILPKRKSAIDRDPVFVTQKVSHGVTAHWLLSAMAVQTDKVLYNSALEPEIGDLISMLRQMGLNITCGNQNEYDKMNSGIVYDGSNRGLLQGVEFKTMPDRLEAATYAFLALGTHGDIRLNGVDVASCRPWLKAIEDIAGPGVVMKEGRDIFIDARNVKEINGKIFQMSPFPGNETDLHQVMTPVLSMSTQTSVIYDAIWPGRSRHLDQMEKFGLRSSHRAVPGMRIGRLREAALRAEIYPSTLHNGNATGTDLRGTMGTIICGAMANGQSRIANPSFALRGYPNLVWNMQNLDIDVMPSQTGASIPPLPGLQKVR